MVYNNQKKKKNIVQKANLRLIKQCKRQLRLF